MSNQEKRNYEENVHMLLAFYRKKLNDSGSARCLRRVFKSDDDYSIIIRECETLGGTWRIHRTVNKRSTTKAFKALQHHMLDHSECAPYIDSLWKTMLLRKESKAEKRFMLDIDTKSQDTLSYLRFFAGEPLERVETPNGHHWIVNPFDRRDLAHLKKVTIMPDGYIFLNEVTS